MIRDTISSRRSRRFSTHAIPHRASSSPHLRLYNHQISPRNQPSPSRSLHSTTSPSPPTPALTKAEALESHAAIVAQISASVRDFHNRGVQFRINHGSTNSTRSGALGRDPRSTVDTRALHRVLHIDPQTRTALVEPNVPMDALVEATLPYGLVPLVVMEFPGITVGGGYAGTSGESSSFRHGFFNRTLKSVEMVLADGEVVVCTPEGENSDLFHGAAGALGTLGVTTMVEIQLHPARRFVETTYHPVSSMAEAVKRIRGFADPETSEYDYVDGIMYSQTRGAIITGRMVDSPPPSMRIQRFSAPSDPWFYLHVQNHLSSSSSPSPPITEAIPLPEYLFRYDRGGFWVGQCAFSYFHSLVPFRPSTRRFLDDFLHTRMLYAALHGGSRMARRRMVIQDLAVPYHAAEEFVEFTASETAIWPLWLCPLRPSVMPTMHPHLLRPSTSSENSSTRKEAGGEEEEEGEQMLNIGLWGTTDPSTFVSTNRTIERKLRECGGMKWLYAQVFASEEDFWADFDKAAYDRLRAKYRAETLPSVWDKVRGKEEDGQRGHWRDTWPLPAFRGMVAAVQSGVYHIHRRKRWAGWVPRE